MMTTPLLVRIYCVLVTLQFSVHGLILANNCNSIQLLTNGQVSCGQYNGLTICYATCIDGYMFDSLAAVERRVCDNSDGVWFQNRSLPKCVAFTSKKACHPLPPPDNGIVRCEHTDSELKCTATCNEGYIFDTQASTITKICDTDDGIWSDGVTLPACVRKTSGLCQLPGQPKNGQMKCTRSNDRLVCTGICNDGFSFRSNNQSFMRKTCILSNGLWIDGNINFPQCAENSVSTNCSAISSEHTNVRCKETNSILKCTATCGPGYGLASSYSVIMRMCSQLTGKWLNGNTFPKCLGTCDDSLLANVPDNHFTSSSQYNSPTIDYSASRSRMTPQLSPNGSINRGWRPLTDDLNQFIQVELNKVSNITSIVTQGLHGENPSSYVTRFRILHSVDGLMFTPYADGTVSDKFLSGNNDAETVQVNRLDRAFLAKYIRINPLEWQGHIGLRFDVRGCVESQVSSSTTSRTTPQVTMATGKATTTAPVTQPPTQTCRSPAPPNDGVVYCQGTSSELVCTAQCKDGYEFSTRESLIKRACDKRDGTWINGDSYPPCIALPTALPTTPSTDRNCISSQIDCLNKLNGDYQTCGACHFYASCSEGYVYVRPCPTNLHFDLNTGRCEFKSDTCFHASASLVGK